MRADRVGPSTSLHLPGVLSVCGQTAESVCRQALPAQGPVDAEAGQGPWSQTGLDWGHLCGWAALNSVGGPVCFWLCRLWLACPQSLSDRAGPLTYSWVMVVFPEAFPPPPPCDLRWVLGQGFCPVMWEPARLISLTLGSLEGPSRLFAFTAQHRLCFG